MKQKRSYCLVCGKDLGPKDCFSDRFDTCEKLECVEKALLASIEDRVEAHERLDREMNW